MGSRYWIVPPRKSVTDLVSCLPHVTPRRARSGREDRAVAKMRNATVACFDPTIDQTRFEKIGGAGDSRLKFFQIGLGSVDGEINFYKPTNPTLGSMVSTPGLSGFYKDPSITAPVRRVASILRDLGDKHVDSCPSPRLARGCWKVGG